jgi:hypothetical protein
VSSSRLDTIQPHGFTGGNGKLLRENASFASVRKDAYIDSQVLTVG